MTDNTTIRKSCAVEVCPDCDIAGCRHIRERTGAFAGDALKEGGVTHERGDGHKGCAWEAIYERKIIAHESGVNERTVKLMGDAAIRKDAGAKESESDTTLAPGSITTSPTKQNDCSESLLVGGSGSQGDASIGNDEGTVLADCVQNSPTPNAERALQRVKERMRQADPYRSVWSDEFIVIDHLLQARSQATPAHPSTLGEAERSPLAKAANEVLALAWSLLREKNPSYVGPHELLLKLGQEIALDDERVLTAGFTPTISEREKRLVDALELISECPEEHRHPDVLISIATKALLAYTPAQKE